MGRHFTAAAPLTGFWAGSGHAVIAVIAAFRRLSTVADASAYAEVEVQQNRIRQTSRHWLAG